MHVPAGALDNNTTSFRARATGRRTLLSTIINGALRAVERVLRSRAWGERRVLGLCERMHCCDTFQDFTFA